MDPESLASRWDADRPHLRAVAYRLLGSLDDADDVVQQVWLKASRSDLDGVENLTGWLTTVTARECLDLLRVRRRRGEVPLPDEAVAQARSGEEEAVLAESVGLALLVVLDRLSPAQRVAFVLHDLFAVPFDQIARVLDRSPTAAKKLASRARERVHGRVDAVTPDLADQLRLTEAFLAASRDGDLRTLLDVLAPDVVRRADPVLVPAGVPVEVRGAAEVAEETRLFAHRARAGAVVLVGGEPGVVVAPAGRLRAVLRLTIHAGRVHRVDIVGDPVRLAALDLTVPPA